MRGNDVPARGRRKGGPPYSMYDLKIKKGTNTSHYPYGARSPRRCMEPFSRRAAYCIDRSPYDMYEAAPA